MRAVKAKKLRKMAYGDRSLKQVRLYAGEEHRFGRVSLVNDPKGDRALYLELKKKFPEGARVC